MTKLAEQEYPLKIGELGRQHAKGKPFSDPNCGTLLGDIGFIMSLLPKPPARLLDLGCGTGWTSCFFAKYGFDVTGQDISQEMINLAEENLLEHKLHNVRFIQSDYENLSFENEFDCAVFYDSLHHAVDESLAIRSAYNALKRGGILITHEPGEGHSAHPHSINAMEQFGVNERDMPPHLIIKAGKQAGFREFQILPLPQFVQTLCCDKKGRFKHSEIRGFRSIKYRIQQILFLRHLSRLFFDNPHRRSSVVILTK